MQELSEDICRKLAEYLTPLDLVNLSHTNTNFYSTFSKLVLPRFKQILDDLLFTFLGERGAFEKIKAIFPSLYVNRAIHILFGMFSAKINRALLTFISDSFEVDAPSFERLKVAFPKVRFVFEENRIRGYLSDRVTFELGNFALYFTRGFYYDGSTLKLSEGWTNYRMQF